MSKIVIALGGNALGNSPSEQKKAVKVTAKVIVKLSQAGHNVVVVHGNGPQVGWINNAFMNAYKNNVSKEILPFAECGAMSQGYIGYHIQNAIQNELLKNGIEDQKVATLVSQTVVDKNDSGFKNPTKPIGDFLSESEAKDLAKENNWVVKEDAGRGWRRTVASPKPHSLPSLSVLELLINNNVITIVGGGGGIPTIKDDSLQGVDAVIDKDSTASFIATKINADSLMILTAVDQIKINYNKPDEKSLATASVEELKDYIKDNQFAPGSMLPKVLAAISFVEKTNNSAFIGELENANLIIQEKSGTKIYK